MFRVFLFRGETALKPCALFEHTAQAAAGSVQSHRAQAFSRHRFFAFHVACCFWVLRAAHNDHARLLLLSVGHTFFDTLLVRPSGNFLLRLVFCLTSCCIEAWTRPSHQTIWDFRFLASTFIDLCGRLYAIERKQCYRMSPWRGLFNPLRLGIGPFGFWTLPCIRADELLSIALPKTAF